MSPFRSIVKATPVASREAGTDQLRVFGLAKSDFDTHIPASVMALKGALRFGWAPC